MAEKSSSRVRCWTFIVWQESAPSDFVDRLRKLHVPCAISPLHDKDKHKDDDGDHKKPHWHVILNFSGVKSYEQVKEVTDDLCAGFPVRVEDIGGLTRYLIHLDDPDKAQYDRDKIISLSGYDVDFYFDLPKSKVTALLREMGLYIVDHNILEFSDLVEYSLFYNPDWYFIASQVSTKFLMGWIDSRRHKLKDDIALAHKGKVNVDGELC